MSNDKREFPKLKYPLSAQQEAYILKQLNTGLSVKKVFDLISSPDNNIRPEDVERFLGTFNTFRQRVNRKLLQGVSTRRTRKKKLLLNSAEDKLAFLAGIIQESNSRPDVKLKALEMFSELQRQIGLESGDKSVLVANPDKIVITPEFIRETILLFRADMGGLHTLDLNVLTKKELLLLIEAAQKAIDNKHEPDITTGESHV